MIIIKTFISFVWRRGNLLFFFFSSSSGFLKTNEGHCIFEREIVKLPSKKLFSQMDIKIIPKRARKIKELLFVSTFLLQLHSKDEHRFFSWFGLVRAKKLFARLVLNWVTLSPFSNFRRRMSSVAGRFRRAESL